MIRAIRQPVGSRQIGAWLIAAAVLGLAFLLGRWASPTWLGLLAAGIGGVALLARPVLGLPALVLAALVVPLGISTGTEVNLNAASLLVPAMLAVWLLYMIRRRSVELTASPVNRPLLLFLAAGVVSLLVGRATWDPTVPVQGNFLLVQLAQWAIFGFSAGAFWLTANLVKDERWLWRLTAFFLLVGGGLAILRTVPGVTGLVGPITTVAFVRAPFWILLAALAGGQLLFNRSLSAAWKLFLGAGLAATLVYAFVQQQEAASNWVGLVGVAGVLFWFRFPRLRGVIVVLALLLAAGGLLFPAIYQFAGGDAEWTESGGSRLALIGRVIEVTMRNPVTGLGPAAYRPYANATPLIYAHIFWANPQVSSHNNIIDLFAHVGLLGLALFFWFAAEIALLCTRLRRRLRQGFASGYLNGMLAAGAASLVIMLLADWILPFVYNIGFPGFQASVLIWLFLGGLVALEGMAEEECVREQMG